MPTFEEFLLGKESSADISQQALTTKEQQNALSQVLQSLTGAIPSGGQSQVGKVSGTEKGITSQITGQATGAVPYTSPVFASAEDALLGFLNRDREQAFQTSIVDPTIRTFREQILPEVSRRFGSSFYSKGRQDAELTAVEELNRTLAEQRLGFEQNKDATTLGAIQAIQGLEGAQTADINQLVTALQAAGLERNTQMDLLSLILQGALSPTLENIATVNPPQQGAYNLS